MIARHLFVLNFLFAIVVGSSAGSATDDSEELILTSEEIFQAVYGNRFDVTCRDQTGSIYNLDDGSLEVKFRVTMTGRWWLGENQYCRAIEVPSIYHSLLPDMIRNELTACYWVTPSPLGTLLMSNGCEWRPSEPTAKAE